MKASLFIAAAASLFAGAASAQPLTDPELESYRGAYIVVDGLTLDFGAVVRSYAGQEMVLETRYSLSDSGLVTERAGAGAPLGQSSQLNLPALSGLGEVYTSSDGQTAFVHEMADGRLANMIVNTASNRELRQETSMTLTLPGFEAVQQGMSDALMGRRLADDISAAAGVR